MLEVTLIGGEAYLRDDWLEIVARDPRRGHAVHDDDRRPRPHRRARARRRGRGGPAERQRLDRRRRGDARSAARRRRLVPRRRWTPPANLRAAGVRRLRQHADQPAVDAASCPTCSRRSIALGAHAWQIQLTVAMGRAADEPEVLLQPYDLLELFPLLARLEAPLRRGAACALWPGNNIGYFGPYEAAAARRACRAGTWRRAAPAARRSASRPTARSRAARRCRPTWTGGNIRDASLQDIWERSAPLRYTRDRTVDDLWGYCRTCYYADECRAGCTWTGFALFGKPGNNPLCHHRALEMRQQGKRERLVQVARAPGVPFDHGRFEIVVEEIDMSVSRPAPLATATSPPTQPPVRSVRWRCRIRSVSAAPAAAGASQPRRDASRGRRVDQPRRPAAAVPCTAPRSRTPASTLTLRRARRRRPPSRLHPSRGRHRRRGKGIREALTPTR